MKKIFFLFVATLLSVTLYAQPGGGPGMGGPGPGMMGGSSFTMTDPDEQAKEFVESIKDSLQLDAKQEKAITKLYSNHFNKLQILKAQISDLEKATDQRLSSEILTQDQATKWKTLKKSLRKFGKGQDNSNGSNNNFGDGMMPPPMMGGGGPGMF